VSDRHLRLRRCFIEALVVALLAPLRARPQTKDLVRRLGVLEVGAPGVPVGEMDAFIDELRRRGYVEGENLVIERRYAYSDQSRFDSLAAELVALKPDVIYTAAGTLGAMAAQRATTTIPIVFDASSDPVGTGLVADLARPGGNLTGTQFLAEPMDYKRLQMLVEALRAPRCIGVLGYTITRKRRDRFHDVVSRTAAEARLLFFEVARAEDLEATFDRMTSDGVDALVIVATPFTHANAARIAALVAQHRLPAIADGRRFAEGGLLMTYSVSFVELYRRGAENVSRILNGAKPADLPIDQASRFEMVVNLRTAKELGVALPRNYLVQADSVIK